MKTNQLFLFLALLSLFSCKFQEDSGPQWDADYLLPLFKSSVSLSDAVQNDGLLQVNPDNSLTLVFRDTLLHFKLSDYLQVPDTSLTGSVTLDSINLTTGTITQRESVKDLLEANGYGAVVIYLESFGKYPAVPAQPDLNSAAISINASEFFDEAWLNQGWIDLEVQNNLPADMDSVVFQLSSDSLGTQVILRDTILSIPQKTTGYSTANLAGFHVTSSLWAQLIQLDLGAIPANTPYDEDDDYLEIRVTLRDLKADSAIAVFPEQKALDVISSGNYSFGNDIGLTRLDIKSGNLTIDALNSVENPIKFVYSLPTMLKDGQPVSTTANLQAATGPNSPFLYSEIFDLSGYSADLTINGEAVNRFPQHLEGYLVYTGKKVKLTVLDSIQIKYKMGNIVPSYVEGYLGKKNFSFQESQRFSFFDGITGGELKLENPQLELSFLNSIGIDNELVINQLLGINQRNGKSVNLTSNRLGGSISLPGPSLPDVGSTVSTRISMDKTNSNLGEFLSLLPDSIFLDLDVLANANGDPSVRDNFATDQSAITALMDLSIPLHGIADELQLETEMPLDLTELALSKDLKKGRLDLYVENEFPFTGKVQVYIYEANGNLSDSLFTAQDIQILPPGTIGPDGIVIEPGKGKLTVSLNEYRFGKLKANPKTARLVFSLNTIPQGKPVKLYSNYRLNFKLVGDFTLRQGM